MKCDSSKSVTVTIPTLGRAEFLDQTLHSVRKALNQHVQVLIVDNSGSKAVDPDILKNAGLSGEIIYQSETKPVAENWNDCLRHSNTAWVHILHDDDWVHQDFYDQLIEDIDSGNHYGLWTCHVEEIYPDRDNCLIKTPVKGALTDRREIYEVLIKDKFARCVGTVINKNSFLQLGGFDSGLKTVVDVEGFWRLATFAGLYISPHVLGYYRIHSNSIVGGNYKAGRIRNHDNGSLLYDQFVILKKNKEQYGKIYDLSRAVKLTSWQLMKYYGKRLMIWRFIEATRLFLCALWQNRQLC